MPPLPAAGSRVRIERTAVSACYRTLEGTLQYVEGEEHVTLVTESAQHRFERGSLRSVEVLA